MTSRGLVIEDEALAKKHLSTIGYYRFIGYALPFQIGGTGSDHHDYKAGVTFDSILDRYIFDRKFRLLILDAIERIEVSIRADLSNYIAPKHGSHWYNDKSLFNSEYDHAALINNIKYQIGHNGTTDDQIQKRDIFIKHYYENYYDPEIPACWMILESISFGTISRMFEGLAKYQTSEIFNPYSVNQEVFCSWLHSISYVRNLCAHHSRVWNKTLTIKPKIAKKHKTKFNGNEKIYSVLVVIQILLEKIAPDNSWAERLAKLIGEHPDLPLANMGFPENWRERDFWVLAINHGLE